MERKVNVIEDMDGKKTVFIHDIIFKGKRSVKWDDVEKYLKQYVGDIYTINDSNDTVYIGTDLPDEYTHSNYTHVLKGANAKAKANATTETIGLLKYASNKRWQKNFKIKHGIDAAYGWYRFTSRFALPVYTAEGILERYNIYRIEMLVRHASDDKLYLYDMVNTKKEKETNTPS